VLCAASGEDLVVSSVSILASVIPEASW